jgi:hypothetical protein
VSNKNRKGFEEHRATAEGKSMATDKAPASVTAIEIAPRATLIERDAEGRFLTGNSGGGRRKGARNKLSEIFLDIIAKDFAEHGAEVIERVREGDPVMYLRILGSLVPRELIKKREQAPDSDYAELTDEEVIEMIEAERRRTLVQRVLKALPGT